MPTIIDSYKKPPEIKLKNIPDDVSDYIVITQAHEKIKCKCSRSKEFTVYAMLRELKQLKEKNKIFKK